MSASISDFSTSLSVTSFLVWAVYQLLRRWVDAHVRPGVPPDRAKENLRLVAAAIAVFLAATFSVLIFMTLLARLYASTAVL